jgi:nicotinamide mononucleotide (NMN) deamidase PncC
LSVVTAESCTGGLFGEAGRAEVRYQAVMAALALLERAV